MKLLPLFLLLLGVVQNAQAAAAPADANFATQVAANQHQIAIETDGSLSGPGAELISRDIGKAQFFMVGEQHATAGIAKVNLGLHRLAAKQGYHHAALEIGPDSTREVERLVRSGQGRLAAFIREPGNDFVLPFLGWAEETALVEQIVDLSRARSPVLWGIDQEFVGSANLHLAHLGRLARSPEQRTLLAELGAKAKADPLLIGMLDLVSYDRLRRAFPGAAYPGAARLIDDLAASTAIYAPFRRQGRLAAGGER